MTRSNSVKLINKVIDQMKAGDMDVRIVKEPDIDEDSAIEHTIDLDVIYDEVIFNVRIESILFAGHIEPTKE